MLPQTALKLLMDAAATRGNADDPLAQVRAVEVAITTIRADYPGIFVVKSASTVAVNENGLRIGEDHQNARHSNGTVEILLNLRDEGMSYRDIAYVMGIPRNTVRRICSGERRCQTPVNWRKVRVA